MSLYKLESEHATWVNLESDLSVLQDHQQRLQKLAARVAADLAIVTSVIVGRQADVQVEPN